MALRTELSGHKKEIVLAMQKLDYGFSTKVSKLKVGPNLEFVRLV